MPLIAKRNLPKVYRSILLQQQKLVVWGATRSLTFHEWKRQVSPEFIVDPQWEQLKGKLLHGCDVYAPSAIQNLRLDQTIISNNYYYGPAKAGISSYLTKLGGYRSMNPATLDEMARLVNINFSKSSKIITRKKLITEVNATLEGILVSPGSLHKKKHLPSLPELQNFFGSYDNKTYLAECMPGLREESASTYRARAGHVCLFIGALHSGGAERQICNLALGLKRAGWIPTILVYETGLSETLHYRQFLADAGIDYYVTRPPDSGNVVEDALSALENIAPDILMALWHVRAELILQTLYTYKALRKLRPELLISYLDWQNVFSGLASMMAGVPRFLMSGRNAAPTNFPHFFGAMTDSFKDIYNVTLQQKDYLLCNNSSWGSRSYSRWLGVSAKEVPVVLNCITEEFRQPISPIATQALRKKLGFHKEHFMILGVFRLAPEKHPFDFVRVIAALHKKHPHIRAVICGSGSLDQEVRALIKKLKLTHIVALQGVVRDIPIMMGTANLLLHTSEAEGSPNVILEAQAIGLPVVCTDSGGIIPCLAKPWLSFMKKVGDIKGLAASCHKLIKESQLREKHAASSRSEILQRFSIESLTRNTLVAAGINPNSSTMIRHRSD